MTAVAYEPETRVLNHGTIPVLKYILKRLLIMIPTLFGIIVLSFGMIQLAPGDPAAQRYGAMGQAAGSLNAEKGTQAFEQAFRERYHLDKPIPVQFWYFLDAFSQENSATCNRTNRSWRDLLRHLWVSGKINLIVFVLIYLFAVPIGIYSAAFPRSFLDRSSTVFLFILYSLPAFWVAELLRIWLCHDEAIFRFPVQGLNSQGFEQLSWWEQQKDYIWHITLPVLCLTYGGLAYISRQMRAGMLEVIRQDYIRTAEAKGCSKARTILVHALRNRAVSDHYAVCIAVTVPNRRQCDHRVRLRYPGYGQVCL